MPSLSRDVQIATEINQEKAEAFAEKMIGVLNGGALTLMISVGHRTGLFDAMSDLPPSTSHEIAEEAALNERYVREWLGAMVTGDIVAYDHATENYQLPPEHAAFLTRAASPDNLGVPAQFIPVCARVEDDIVECFKHGGGVPYSKYHRFHEVMAEDSGQTVVSGLFEHILPLVPGLAQRLETGIKVLDVGCGRGKALMQLAKAYPATQFTGCDISSEAIVWATKSAEDNGLANVTFFVADAAQLDEIERYDLITAFDVIHDQKSPDLVLFNIKRALKSGGVYLMQDIKGSSYLENNLDHPIAPLFYTLSTMHCMSVSLAQDGMGLGTMWGKEKALEMLTDAGFTNVEVNELPHDIQNYFYVCA